jgi:hypothetical protein
MTPNALPYLLIGLWIVVFYFIDRANHKRILALEAANKEILTTLSVRETTIQKQLEAHWERIQKALAEHGQKVNEWAVETVDKHCSNSEERFWSRIEAYESLVAACQNQIFDLAGRVGAMEKSHHEVAYVPRGDAMFNIQQLKAELNKNPVYGPEIVSHIDEVERLLKEGSNRNSFEELSPFSDLEI